ncbi:TPA: hypothetical protein U0R94_004877 [Escherichia coli]|nr:hypothetical protein [Escherichia coli]HEM0058995.1 hypothetical protein [Escherichia coli]HEM0073324.1 hypothetical protein [Escherichia coli]
MKKSPPDCGQMECLVRYTRNTFLARPFLTEKCGKIMEHEVQGKKKWGQIRKGTAPDGKGA